MQCVWVHVCLHYSTLKYPTDKDSHWLMLVCASYRHYSNTSWSWAAKKPHKPDPACFIAASVGAGLPCRWWECFFGVVFWFFLDFFLLGRLYGTEAICNQNLYETLFPQLTLVKVSGAVDAHVHSSVTTEKVTPPVSPHSNYTSWEFPDFNVAEGSIFPLMVWHSLKINNAITPQNGFSYGDVWRTGMDCICKTCFRAQICFCALQMCSWCQQLCTDDHWLMKNKVCLAQVDKCPCKYHSADPKRRLWAGSCTPLLKQLFTSRATSGIFCSVKRSCHGEITHSSDETNYFIAEINPECTNGGEWRVGWCFLLKVECNWLSGIEEGMAGLWFYCRVCVAAMCCLGVKRRKGTLEAFGMPCLS